MKKGQMSDWLVHVSFYLGLLVLLLVILYLLRNKIADIWQAIVEKLRFS